MGPDHFVVCGGNALAHRLVVELSEQYEVPVVAIVPPGDHQHVTQIVKVLDPDSVFEDALWSDEVFVAAEITSALAIAFVDGDDQGTIHAAMRAARMSPGIRIVIRMYNQRLAAHIQQLIPNCTVLSASATAAPAFVNAALRRPLSVAAGGRALRVAVGQDIDQQHALFLVADRVDPADPAGIEMLPETASHAREWMAMTTPGNASRQAVLQFLDSEPPVRPRRGAWLAWRLVDVLRYFTSAKLRTILIGALATLVVSFAGIWYLSRPFGWALYETLLDVAGSAVPDVYGQPSAVGGGWQRVFQVAITVSGVLLMPVVTAVFVEGTAARRAARERRPSAGIRGHVVIVGLGNNGLRVATLFNELGVPVVGIERDPTARGIAAVHGMELPVLVGDAPIEEMLRRAHVGRARAVLALTGDDVANLEAALEARAIQPGVRVVVRLFDDNFAEHVYRQFPNTASRSVSYLAAPAFAAAMMGREVLGTLSVYRKVLLIAELSIDADSPFLARPLRELDSPGMTRVLALKRPRDADFVWRPPDHSRRLEAGDRLVVAATRAGLGALHTGRDVSEPVVGDGGSPADRR